MKTIVKWCIRIAIMIAVIVAAGYFLFAFYYRDHFAFGTWAGGNYITGMSVSEAAELLNSQYEPQSLSITDINGKKYTISAKDIDIRADYTASLETALDRQNVVTWLLRLFKGKRELTMVPELSCDEAVLEKTIDRWPMFDLAQEDRTVKIGMVVGEGYQLLNTMENVPVEDEITAAVSTAIQSGETSINLANYDSCYTDLPLTAAMQSISDTYDKIAKVQETGISYAFSDGGDLVPFDGAFVGDILVTKENVKTLSAERTRRSIPGSGKFLINGKETSFPEKYLVENGFVTDSKGNLILSESLLYTELTSLCGQYNTVGDARTFTTSKGDTISVEGGTYGNQIDMEEEFAYIVDALVSGRQEVHEPDYSQTVTEKDGDDIGNTYVEISIADQHLYYYEKGKKVFESDVVTGNTKLGHDTPTGVYYVYGKAKNRYLRGQGYVSFVSYWMPVFKGVGMHDASWRDKFGGDIYETKGSHGCINLPKKKAQQLYERIEIGTPVVIY